LLGHWSWRWSWHDWFWLPRLFVDFRLGKSLISPSLSVLGSLSLFFLSLSLFVFLQLPQHCILFFQFLLS
jgi:hypothetical protein